MHKQRTKEEIVEVVKKILPSTNTYRHWPHDKLIFKWFVTGRSGTGLRLTEVGKDSFLEAKIEHYDFDLEVFEGTRFKQPEKITLELGKKLSCPYFVGVEYNTSKKKPVIYLRIYDHKIAMLISIYGTVNEYLNAIEIRED